MRPEAWRLVSRAEGGLPVEVTVVEELGADGFVYGTCDVEGTPRNVIVRVTGRDNVHKGDTIYVTTDPHERARLRHRHRRAPQPVNCAVTERRVSQTVGLEEGGSPQRSGSVRIPRGRWNAEKIMPGAVALIASRPDLEGMSVAGWLDELVRWSA